MSRYMELSVTGTIESVAERARAAFRAVGKIEEFAPDTHICGTIKAAGAIARVLVRWRERGEGVHIDIEAASSDALSRAADAALFDFAREYKALVVDENERWNDGPALERALPWYSLRRWLGRTGQAS